MKIFDGGSRSYPPDTFTLGCGGKELEDDVELRCLCKPNELLTLFVHSVTFLVLVFKDIHHIRSGTVKPSISFPLTIKVEDSSLTDDIIKPHILTELHRHRDYVNVKYVDIRSYVAFPGDIIKVLVQ
jgi:hypothetical protein